MELIKRINTSSLFVAVACLSLIAVLTLSALPAGAQVADSACDGFQAALGEQCGDGGEPEQINSTLATAVNILSTVVGIIAVFMIIIAGIRYITSNGDPGTVKSARDTVIYAVIGLLIVTLAQVIVRFVLGETGDVGGGGGGGVPPPLPPGGGPG